MSQQHPSQEQVAPKSHKVRNIVLVIVGLIILSCGGCFAVTGAFFNEVDKEIKKSEKEDKLPGGPDNPMTI